ncbi:IFT52 [Lepeophtheirus salmonis]|uniref:IFT52 n=1 Tax=Lepeophtheirus salmonis TaxID=72036 RepID=A0A7R8D027_LEPSM|nr:IFT52 [Lepeophtheirus salmonis]CAF2955674.1 IFT52 [Lepeophtheirus salmonis]
MVGWRKMEKELPNGSSLSSNVGKSILFDVTKDEAFKITEGFKSLQRKLKSMWKILSNKDDEDIKLETLSQGRVFVLAGPRQKFTENEINNLKKYLEDGGSILVLLGEGGEKNYNTNINFFLEEYGIMINCDSVVRTNYYKYFHPKEVYISNGILNQAVTDIYAKPSENDLTSKKSSFSFLYPHGATLNVAKPAVSIFSTGSGSYPLNRPICAFYKHPTTNGKLAVLGSTAIFSDQYIDKEDNHKLKDIIFNFLTSDEIILNKIDAEDPEISDYNYVPDTPKVSDQLRVCLQESEEVPQDFTRLFDHKLFSVNTDFVPAAINAYNQLGAAVFPPSFRELKNPNLELFDLDEAFSSEKSRLAQLSNKCGDSDLDYFIREVAEITGVNHKLPVNIQNTHAILEYLLTHLVEFKKLNEDSMVMNTGPDV